MENNSDINKVKIDSLISSLAKEGYDSTHKINKSGLIKYLNNHSIGGEFDPILLNKLLQILDLDKEKSEISIENFISGYIQFEENIKNNTEILNTKLIKEKEIYEKLIEDIKLNSEEPNKNAKIFGEITEIDIQKKLKGIKKIIIKVIFNNEKEEFQFELGEINKEQMDHKKFEFKPTSRKDHFEFIMQGINGKNEIFDIGSKIFSLLEIKSKEEYIVQIIVPEIEDEKKIAAYINANIKLIWNDFNYEEQMKKVELKIKKIKIALENGINYLKKIKEIYDNLTIKKQKDLDVYYNNIKRKEVREKKYIVEFNNVKEVQLKVEFNNTKEMGIHKQKEISQENFNNSDNEEEKVEEKEEEKEEKEENEEKIEKVENMVVIEKKLPENLNEIKTSESIYVNENMNKIIENEYINKEEEMISANLDKETFNTIILPTIIKEKVNEVIYDDNVLTLPLILGDTKVTYLNNTDITNNIIQQETNQINNFEEYNQYSQGQEYNQINNNIEEYNQYGEAQEFNLNQGQEYNFNQGGNYDQIIQGGYYNQQQMFNTNYYKTDIKGSINYGEYQSTKY